MTEEEEKAALEAICARLGKPMPKHYDAEWAGLLLAQDAQGKPKKPRKLGGPVRPPGRPTEFWSWLNALTFSRIVSDLIHESKKQNKKMSEIQACEEVCKLMRKRQRELLRTIQDEDTKDVIKKMKLSEKTLRRKSIRLRTERDKFINDERFKTRLLRDRDSMLLRFKVSFEDKGAADAEISRLCDIVAEYLGEDDREHALKRINEIVEKDAVRISGKLVSHQDAEQTSGNSS